MQLVEQMSIADQMLRPTLPADIAAQDRDMRFAELGEIFHERSRPAIFLAIECS